LDAEDGKLPVPVDPATPAGLLLPLAPVADAAGRM